MYCNWKTSSNKMYYLLLIIIDYLLYMLLTVYKKTITEQDMPCFYYTDVVMQICQKLIIYKYH